MDCQTRERDGVTIITLSGELKAVESQEIKGQIIALMEQGKNHIVIDMDGVTFMTSAGLGLIGVTHKNLFSQGGRLVLLRVPQRIRDIFVIARLQDVLQFSDSEEDAVQRAGA
jgi:anti-sigma B factor antagonist